MPRHQYRSIKDEGGIEVHLNNSKTLHRGFGYKTYKILRFSGVNVANRARAFNVASATMKSWDRIYDKERLDAIKGNI